MAKPVYRADIDAATIIAALGPTKAGKCHCPICGGKSLTVRDGNKGAPVVKCWSNGCDRLEIIEQLKSKGLWGKAANGGAGGNGKAKPQRTLEERVADANRIWRAAKAGDVSEVPYLQKRGIKRTPACARLLTAGEARGLDLGLPGFPALVFPIYKDGKLTGCHVIKLTKDMTAKLACDTPKQSWGDVKGGYVRLSDHYDPDKPLIVGEGIETVLSAMQLANWKWPGIACTGTSMLEAVEPPEASLYVIAGDSDKAGDKAARALADRLTRQGLKCRIAVAPGNGKDKFDWNDAVQDDGATTPVEDLHRLLTQGKQHKIVEPKTEATLLDNDGEDDDREQAELDGEAVEKLARLSVMDYDRARKDAAKELGVQVATLDKLVRDRREELMLAGQSANGALAPWEQVVEPWDKRPNGEKLLDRVYKTIDTYIAMGESERVAVTLWVMHAWSLDAALHNPFLHIWSPVKGCGKSTLLTVLSRLVPRPLFISNVTAASVFRIADARNPSMLVDEADTFMKENEGLRGVLNAAHGKEGAFVIRTVGEGADLTVKRFKVWVPIAIAGIGKIHPTLEDRSLSIQLHRQNRGEEKEQVPRDGSGTADLRRRCARWAQDHLEGLKAAQPLIPDGLRNRSRDLWWSMLAIAEAAGGDWPQRARKAAVRLVRRAVSDDEDFRSMLLEDVRYVFQRRGRDGYMSSTEVVRCLVEEMELEGRPWREFSRGKPITTTALARMLKPFGAKPKKLSQGGRPMGYELHGPLQRAFDRFLPPLAPAPAKKSRKRKDTGLFGLPSGGGG